MVILVLLPGALLLAGCGGAGDQAGNRADKPSDDSESVAPENSTSSGDAGEQVFVAGGSYVQVPPTELRAMLQDKDFTFVNTHIPFEGNIPGTDLSIPYNGIDQNLGLLPTDKDARIMLYCKSGRMSAEAAETLVKLGYTNVWDLAGGMVAWADAGLPLEGTWSGRRPVTFPYGLGIYSITCSYSSTPKSTS